MGYGEGVSLLRSARRAASTGAVALALCSLSPGARADEGRSLEGSWSASGMSESWSTSEWGPACGPKPAGRGAGGGSVTVRAQGAELVMQGAGRTYSTSECWEQLPGLARVSHSASKRAWSTRCTTPAGDPRRAAVVMAVSATDTSIAMRETGTYEFLIQGETCKASVVRSRSLSRPAEAAPSAAAPALAPSAPAPPSKPSECGPPARLELAPSRKLLRPGERAEFAANLFDRAGCLTSARPVLSLVVGPPLTGFVTVAGREVVVAPSAPEGVATLVASHEGRSVRARIDVVDPARYEEALRAAAANASGAVEAPAVEALLTVHVESAPAIAERTGADARDWVLVLGFVAVGTLAVGALVVARAGRLRSSIPPGGSVPPQAPPSEPPPHGSSDATETTEATAPPSAMPSSLAPATRPRAKVCPTCGTRFGPEADFCGADGTSLVPLNVRPGSLP